MANFYLTAGTTGLGTVLTTVVPDTQAYIVSGTHQLPTIPQGSQSQSQVVTVVNKNGSPVYTSNAGDRGFRTLVNCTAADTITIVLSSAAVIDQAANVIKSTLGISEGEC